ncbi:hypothetical protein AAFH68_43780 [Flavobacterium sp. CGRL1]
MIEIQNIKDITEEDITNLLFEQKEQPFQIYIPKSTHLYSSTNQDIAIDYAMLAYSGQLLKDASDNFEYDSVNVAENKSILFEISTDDIPKLANAILEISIGYNNEHKDYDEIYYHESVQQFLDDSNNKQIITACPDFVEIYNEYIEEDEDDDNVLRIV